MTTPFLTLISSPLLTSLEDFASVPLAFTLPLLQASAASDLVLKILIDQRNLSILLIAEGLFSVENIHSSLNAHKAE